MRRTGGILIGALAAAVALGAATHGGGAPAQAQQAHARAPQPAEAQAIAAAVLGELPQEFRARIRLTGVRVSTRSRHWATAVVAPRPAYRDTMLGSYVILVRSAVSGGWTVVDAGTSGVGCPIAPISVLRDLGRAGECPARDRL